MSFWKVGPSHSRMMPGLNGIEKYCCSSVVLQKGEGSSREIACQKCKIFLHNSNCFSFPWNCMNIRQQMSIPAASLSSTRDDISILFFKRMLLTKPKNEFKFRPFPTCLLQTTPGIFKLKWGSRKSTISLPHNTRTTKMYCIPHAQNCHHSTGWKKPRLTQKKFSLSFVFLHWLPNVLLALCESHSLIQLHSDK